MSEALRDLLKRAEACEGPDREIDALLHSIVKLGRAVIQEGNSFWEVDSRLGRRKLYSIDPGVRQRNASVYDSSIPRYSSSLDATIALALKMFDSPLVGVNLERDNSIGFDNDIPGGEEAPRWNAWCYGESGQHPTSPALALLASLLRALIAKKEMGE